jgi:hypothetical protein
MTQQQKTAKRPQDLYAQRGKKLNSAVQRLRGWIGSDPSKNPELADALVELNMHRLLGHDYNAAAPDAQDALRRSAELLTATGPIGPYTSVDDAVRYLTALVHLAVTQAGLGLSESAGRTMSSVDDVLEQLRDLSLQERLDPLTAIWALSCSARGALASGEIGAANAYADAALARLAESGLRADPDSSYVAMDVDRLAADSRWAAGRPEESLGFLHEAKQRYDQVVDGRLREPGGLSPALLERLAEPLFGLYRDMADRLLAGGEIDLGLVTRRELVALVGGLVKSRGEPAQVQLASALADLADDLLESGRVQEAEAAASEAAATMPDSPGAGTPHLLVASIRARVLTRADRGTEAVPMLRSAISAQSSDSSAARAVALLALVEALRSTGDTEAAATVDREFDHLARDLPGASRSDEDVRTALQDAARGVVRRGVWLQSWQPLSMSASYAATTASAARSSAPEVAATQTGRDGTAAWLEAQRAEAHRLELERLETARSETARREAEQAEAERAAAERAAEERAQVERDERAEAARRAAAEEAERLERKRRRAERLEAHRLEVERREAEHREAERLEAARQAGAMSGAGSADAERDELERIQAELTELERAEEQARAEAAEAERLEAERAEAQRAEAQRAEAQRAEAQHAAAEQAEAERAAAAQAEAERAAAAAAQAEAERAAAAAAQAEAERAAAERLEAERARVAEPEAAEEHELAVALGEWHVLRSRGDRRAARAANERVIELLRPRAETDMSTYGSQLLDALEELSRARLRSGDVWGSRAPAKEAKALARDLGR